MLPSRCRRATVVLPSFFRRATVVLTSYCHRATVMLSSRYHHATVVLPSCYHRAAVALPWCCRRAAVALPWCCRRTTVVLSSRCRRECRLEGVRGFYKGISISMMQSLPNICIVFVMYETIRQSFDQHYTGMRTRRRGDDDGTVTLESSSPDLIVTSQDNRAVDATNSPAVEMTALPVVDDIALVPIGVEVETAAHRDSLRPSVHAAASSRRARQEPS